MLHDNNLQATSDIVVGSIGPAPKASFTCHRIWNLTLSNNCLRTLVIEMGLVCLECKCEVLEAIPHELQYRRASRVSWEVVGKVVPFPAYAPVLVRGGIEGNARVVGNLWSEQILSGGGSRRT